MAAARSSVRGWDEVISDIAGCLSVQTPPSQHLLFFRYRWVYEPQWEVSGTLKM